MSKHRRSGELGRTARELEALAYIGAVASELADLLPALARRDREPAGPDGYPGSTGYGSSSGGEPTSPTERAALRLAEAGPYPDPLRAARRLASRNVMLAARALATAHAATNTALGHAPPRQLPACRNCGRPITGTVRDERCEACYRYRRRTGTERTQGVPTTPTSNFPRTGATSDTVRVV